MNVKSPPTASVNIGVGACVRATPTNDLFHPFAPRRFLEPLQNA